MTAAATAASITASRSCYSPHLSFRTDHNIPSLLLSSHLITTLGFFLIDSLLTVFLANQIRQYLPLSTLVRTSACSQSLSPCWFWCTLSLLSPFSLAPFLPFFLAVTPACHPVCSLYCISSLLSSSVRSCSLHQHWYSSTAGGNRQQRGSEFSVSNGDGNGGSPVTCWRANWERTIAWLISELPPFIRWPPTIVSACRSTPDDANTHQTRTLWWVQHALHQAHPGKRIKWHQR